jgi:hypothetical protein
MSLNFNAYVAIWRLHDLLACGEKRAKRRDKPETCV